MILPRGSVRGFRLGRRRWLAIFVRQGLKNALRTGLEVGKTFPRGLFPFAYFLGFNVVGHQVGKW